MCENGFFYMELLVTRGRGFLSFSSKYISQNATQGCILEPRPTSVEQEHDDVTTGAKSVFWGRFCVVHKSFCLMTSVKISWCVHK